MKSIQLVNNTNKQVYQLYNDAKCNELSDKRFERIKDALHELVNLGQYNRDSFEYMVDVLYNLPNEAISNIQKGNFSTFYKLFYKHTQGLPEDYEMISNLLGAIYTDYKNSPLEDYSWLCDNCMIWLFDVPIFKDKKMDECLSKINYDLNELIKTTYFYTDYEMLSTKRTTIEDNGARNVLKTHLLVTFLKNIDEYNYHYFIPVNLFNYLVSRISEDDIIKMCEFIKYDKNGYIFTRILLDSYYRCINDADITDMPLELK